VPCAALRLVICIPQDLLIQRTMRARMYAEKLTQQRAK